MYRIFRSGSRSKLRALTSASFVTWSVALAVTSCAGESVPSDNPTATGGRLGSGAGRSGTGGFLGTPIGRGGSSSGGTAAASTAGSGTVPVNPGFGGSGSVGAGSGGTSSIPEPPPCVDVEPPPTAEWPDATCEKWATETTECQEQWFAKYCDVSCGRCVPQGSGGAGGEVLPKPCVDAPPPPDPKWPDSTCFEWATETEECGAQWFAKYCDVSCGRCIPEGGVPSVAPDCSGEGLPNVSGSEGFATRYWDCCQTHCAQSGGGKKCGRDGVSGTGDSKSACSGGGSFACYSEAPRAVSKCLAYGHIAKSNANCGACYRIQFTGEGQHKATDPGSMRIKGKQMIVKVTNTGGDVAGSQFDLMVPGGGTGKFNACSTQWGTSDLGKQYGGYLSDCTGTHEAKKECVRKKCMNIPAGDAREGCIWFVDWFEVADNPKFTSQSTNCPF